MKKALYILYWSSGSYELRNKCNKSFHFLCKSDTTRLLSEPIGSNMVFYIFFLDVIKKICVNGVRNLV